MSFQPEFQQPLLEGGAISARKRESEKENLNLQSHIFFKKLLYYLSVLQNRKNHGWVNGVFKAGFQICVFNAFPKILFRLMFSTNVHITFFVN